MKIALSVFGPYNVLRRDSYTQVIEMHCKRAAATFFHQSLIVAFLRTEVLIIGHRDSHHSDVKVELMYFKMIFKCAVLPLT